MSNKNSYNGRAMTQQNMPILATGVKQVGKVLQKVPVFNMICAYCKVTFMRAGDRLNLLDKNRIERIFCSFDCRDRYRLVYASDTCGYCNETVNLSNCYSSPFEKSYLRFCNEEHTRKFLLATTPDALVEEKYVSDKENAELSLDNSIQKCTMCSAEKPSLYCVMFDCRKYEICGKECFESFCKKENLKIKICDNCTETIEPQFNDKISMVFEGKKYEFCKMSCMKQFQFSKKKFVKCSWCSKSRPNLDMIEHAVINKEQKIISHFCCLTCLTKYRALRSQVKIMDCSICGEKAKPEYYVGYINGQMESCCSLKCVKVRAIQSLKSGCDGVFVTRDGIYLHPREIRDMSAQINDDLTSISSSANKKLLSQKIDELRKRSIADNMITLSKRQRKSSASRKHKDKDESPSNNDHSDNDLLTDNLLTNGNVPTNVNAFSNFSAPPRIQREFVPLPIPIPVPVYVPVPLIMFQQPVPEPMPIPVPIPCPVFFPTTMNNADELIASIEELKTSLPSDPLEAEIFAKAAREEDKYKNESSKTETVVPTEVEPVVTVDNLMETQDLIAGNDLLGSEIFEGTNLEEFDLEQDFNPLDWKSTTPLPKPPNHKKGKRTGSSKPAFYSATNTFGLNSKYGLSAWFRHQNSIPNGIHVDFSEIPAAQLCIGLCDFVDNAKNSEGELFRVDSLVYLLLGLQQCLNHNAREHDQIFLNPYYYQFQQKLAVKIDNWQPNIYPHFHVVDTRVWEEHLWQSGQLGAHSPYTLLFTTVFFITKSLSLTCHEDLFEIPFNKVKLGVKSNDDDIKITGFENAIEPNRNNPLQCPVKLVKFYLKKMSQS